MTLLTILQCPLKQDDYYQWPSTLVRSVSRAFHPIQHLLMMQFLGSTAQAFFASAQPIEPFGHRPWPCLNVACPDFMQSCIQEHHISYRHRRDAQPVGRFACRCGFEYARTGPDTTSDDRFQFDRITVYGPVWMAKLAELWTDPTMSLAEMSTQLRVSEDTVKRQADRHGLPFPPASCDINRPTMNRQSKRYADQPVTSDLIRTKRDEWLATLASTTNGTLTEARAANPSLYKWLIAHDRVWLHASAPSARPNNGKGAFANWAERDERFTCLVPVVAEQIVHMPGRARRVCTKSLCDLLFYGKQGSLAKQLHRLPQTSAAIETYTESSQEFALRRIERVKQLYLQEGQIPTRKALINRAGVGYWKKDATIMAAIDQALEELRHT